MLGPIGVVLKLTRRLAGHARRHRRALIGGRFDLSPKCDGCHDTRWWVIEMCRPMLASASPDRFSSAPLLHVTPCRNDPSDDRPPPRLRRVAWVAIVLTCWPGC